MSKQKSLSIIPDERIIGKIYLIRGKKVMFDRDLAELYDVKTMVLNQAVKRNKDRFPEDFMFQLNKKEADVFLNFQFGTSNGGNLKSQSVISSNESSRSQTVILKRGQNIKYLPYVFTEQGVVMLSAVLKSKRAIQVSIHVARVFVKIREILASNKELARKIEKLERDNDKNKQSIKMILKVIAKFMTTNPKDAELKIIGFGEKAK